MAGIVDRQVETGDPWGGFNPRVHNIPAVYVGNVAASNTNNGWTTANHFTNTATAGANYSTAMATQIDYARNVNARFSPNTASSAMYSAGTMVLYGKDYYNKDVSESVAISNMVSVSSPWVGSVNFLHINSISFNTLKFHSDSSSARSAVSFYLGQGEKLGLPVYLQSSEGAVMGVWVGTVKQTTLTATDSTSNNQYTVVTGAYSVGGIKVSQAFASGSLVQVHYKMNGRSTPYEPGRHE